ncbi:MAG: hypothetical protein HC906_09410 [Bacteroidales bacterium]|nr:hypothetical protein [Bacteroidales bacterium]
MELDKCRKFPADIEEVVYSLKDSNEFSQPIQQSYGWHIFRMIDKRPIDSYEKLKADLEKKVFNDVRSRKLNEAFVEKVKNENNFREYKENLKPITALLDETVYEGKWDPQIAESLIDPVFTFGKTDYLQKDFAAFISSQRRYNKNLSIDQLVNDRYTEYVKNMATDYQKSILEEKYPDFRHLMKEYHDGILLFNLTDDMVWNKAVKDTAGLKYFYVQNKQNYTWGERADLSIYSFQDKALTKKVMAVAKKRSKTNISPVEVNENVCENDSVRCLDVKDLKVEKMILISIKDWNGKRAAYW